MSDIRQKMTKFRYLIVGQGIAGTLLAWEFTKRGVDFAVVRSPDKPSSSMIAGGLINPINLRTFRLVRFGNEYMDFCKLIYNELDSFFGTEFFHQLACEKFIHNHEEDLLLKGTERLSHYLSDNPPDLHKGIKKGKRIVFKHTGYLDASLLLDTFKGFLIKENKLIERNFDHALLNVTNNLSYDGEKYDKVIFCEGAHPLNNPWLRSIPFAFNKGELIEIESMDLDVDKIVRDEIFLLPLGKGRFKVGATYSHSPVNRNPSVEGRNQLVEKLDKILDVPYEIVGHYAGIRPSTKDRMPVIGPLKSTPSLIVFNGLGSKGFMMAPYWANHLVNCIMDSNLKINPLVDVNRFGNK